jgi:Zn-dependent protease
MKKQREFSHTLMMLLACILPLFILFVLTISGVQIGGIFFLLFFVTCCVAMFYFMGGAPIKDEEPEEEEVGKDETSAYMTLAFKAKDVFQARRQYREDENLVIEGRLLVNPETAFASIKQRFEGTDVTPLLQENEAGRPTLVLVPGALRRAEEETHSNWLNLLLLGLTIITMTVAGAAHQGVNLWTEPGKFAVGLPYALALLLILGVHELGHYFAARVHNIKVTLPYFIPVPFALGTFGAFIQMKSLSENRRALFDVGVAGPLAGLVVAIPALFYGLKQSSIVLASGAQDLVHGGAGVGSSFLFALIAKLAMGEAVTEGHQIVLTPMAFAGWLGLLVTALNLLPIGQLDGGHIAHALFGRRNAHTIGMVALFSLFLLGLFVWSGLLFWAIIVFFVAGTKSAPPLNDVTKLDKRRVAIGAFAFVLLFLILTPVPHAFYQALGIHCPYI